MKRSPLQGRRKTAAQSLAVVSSLAICGWAQAASPTHTVFAAENALYGSGYDIGTADGWIDSKLRTAIRQYQSDRPELSASGNLDSATLKSLGVEAAPTLTIQSNSVASRSAARDQLGLAANSRPPARSVAAVAPEPKPEPAPEVQEPEPETVEPEVVDATEPRENQVAAVEPAVQSVPAEDSELGPNENLKEQRVTDLSSSVSESYQTPVTADQEPAEVVEVVTGDNEELIAQLPTEPTAAGPDEPLVVEEEPEPVIVDAPVANASKPVANQEAKAEPRPQSSGGFFSWLFDFFFGWIA
ncbi:peptidoglycan-binding domain-containing protein [Marinobacter nauticus]|uniref:peptidoglycan-binding domain-containing protein n=1 Tax=Marinobacter nauticus TaxID=2743 RepID=UPI001C944516|nr:peptidoglycan-binding domain-containing protein [Marinobacter nauticus]MBY5961628.1 peptidoglycan-binding protein [Marinobacter nauticus]MBY6103013.1 peptidoglycan-binding protein [Marinobacter nauticus]